MKHGIYIGIDIGGTWLKGVSYRPLPQFDLTNIVTQVTQANVQRVPSCLGAGIKVDEFIQSLDELLTLLSPDSNTHILGIGVSTAGIVDYAGKRVMVASVHLGAIRSPEWKVYLEKKYNVPVILINDADAVAIGAAASGYLHGGDTIGVMPIGTGVGLSICRNGRRWQPGKSLPLIGSVDTPCGSFDMIGGVSKVSGKVGQDLCLLFSEERFNKEKEEYLSGLTNVVYSACMLYGIERMLIGGGLASTVTSCQFPLGEELTKRIAKPLAILGRTAKVEMLTEGNLLPLIGAVSLAVGERIAQEKSNEKAYAQISTEIPYDPNIALHTMDARQIIEYLWNTEQDAGQMLHASLDDIASAAQTVARKLSEGGRLIYAGAGTSGRLAAIDNVELGCTFGFPRDRALTLIAGGISDAAIEIESNFEEDASAVPEMLLASVNANDVVIGISVSGSAYYVRSALSVARDLGAYTIFIQESCSERPSFAELNISLRSGHEVIAGSTRMKAGTATKKVLNFISTTAMILLGNVHGPYMIGVECINEKLVHRAQGILKLLFGMDENEAAEYLTANKNDLREAIRKKMTKLDGIR